jgi:hypothetical protein
LLPALVFRGVTLVTFLMPLLAARFFRHHSGLLAFAKRKGGEPFDRTAPITLTVIGVPACTVRESFLL